MMAKITKVFTLVLNVICTLMAVLYGIGVIAVNCSEDRTAMAGCVVIMILLMLVNTHCGKALVKMYEKNNV